MRTVTDYVAIAGTVAVAASAGVTAWMAVSTRNVAQRTADLATFAKEEVAAIVQQGVSIERQATASADQVTLARDGLLASVQPWLTLGDAEAGAMPFNVADSGSTPPLIVYASPEAHLRVSVALRNVGPGLAIIEGRSSHLIGWRDPRSGVDEQMEFNWATVAHPVLPPGEQGRAEFDVDLAKWATDVETITHQHKNNGEFAVDIVYGDVLGQRRTRLRLAIARTRPDANWWAVYQLDYFTPPDATSPQPSVRIS